MLEWDYIDVPIVERGFFYEKAIGTNQNYCTL